MVNRYSKLRVNRAMNFLYVLHAVPKSRQALRLSYEYDNSFISAMQVYSTNHALFLNFFLHFLHEEVVALQSFNAIVPN